MQEIYHAVELTKAFLKHCTWSAYCIILTAVLMGSAHRSNDGYRHPVC